MLDNTVTVSFDDVLWLELSGGRQQRGREEEEEEEKEEEEIKGQKVARMERRKNRGD